MKIFASSFILFHKNMKETFSVCRTILSSQCHLADTSGSYFKYNAILHKKTYQNSVFKYFWFENSS